MPCSSCIARIVGCTGTEGSSGTIARSSCQHPLGIRDIGNDEPCHASEQRERLVRVAAPGFLEIEQDG